MDNGRAVAYREAFGLSNGEEFFGQFVCAHRRPNSAAILQGQLFIWSSCLIFQCNLLGLTPKVKRINFQDVVLIRKKTVLRMPNTIVVAHTDVRRGPREEVFTNFLFHIRSKALSALLQRWAVARPEAALAAAAQYGKLLLPSEGTEASRPQQAIGRTSSGATAGLRRSMSGMALAAERPSSLPWLAPCGALPTPEPDMRLMAECEMPCSPQQLAQLLLADSSGFLPHVVKAQGNEPRKLSPWVVCADAGAASRTFEFVYQQGSAMGRVCSPCTQLQRYRVCEGGALMYEHEHRVQELPVPGLSKMFHIYVRWCLEPLPAAATSGASATGAPPPAAAQQPAPPDGAADAARSGDSSPNRHVQFSAPAATPPAALQAPDSFSSADADAAARAMSPRTAPQLGAAAAPASSPTAAAAAAVAAASHSGSRPVPVTSPRGLDRTSARPPAPASPPAPGLTSPLSSDAEPVACYSTTSPASPTSTGARSPALPSCVPRERPGQQQQAAPGVVPASRAGSSNSTGGVGRQARSVPARQLEGGLHSLRRSAESSAAERLEEVVEQLRSGFSLLSSKGGLGRRHSSTGSSGAGARVAEAAAVAVAAVPPICSEAAPAPTIAGGSFEAVNAEAAALRRLQQVPSAAGAQPARLSPPAAPSAQSMPLLQPAPTCPLQLPLTTAGSCPDAPGGAGDDLPPPLPPASSTSLGGRCSAPGLPPLHRAQGRGAAHAADAPGGPDAGAAGQATGSPQSAAQHTPASLPAPPPPPPVLAAVGADARDPPAPLPPPAGAGAADAAAAAGRCRWRVYLAVRFSSWHMLRGSVERGTTESTRPLTQHMMELARRWVDDPDCRVGVEAALPPGALRPAGHARHGSGGSRSHLLAAGGPGSGSGGATLLGGRHRRNGSASGSIVAAAAGEGSEESWENAPQGGGLAAALRGVGRAARAAAPGAALLAALLLTGAHVLLLWRGLALQARMLDVLEALASGAGAAPRC